ncbi:MAG: putative membrane protein [Circular genetic element sp.]|nr:MAG: putative membrane protein [Circular genetic element sp.]
MTNPLEYRKNILSAPLRRTGPEFLSALEKDSEATPVQQAAAFALLAYTAAPVFMGNVLLPAKLIDSGFRGQRMFSHLSYVNTSLGYPMPRFNYITPMSPATRTGQRIGRYVGSFLSPTLHNVTYTGVLGKTRTLAKGAFGGARVGAKLGGRIGGRLIPGVGWALLAYDVYDVAANRSLWGFDLS